MKFLEKIHTKELYGIICNWWREKALPGCRYAHTYSHLYSNKYNQQRLFIFRSFLLGLMLLTSLSLVAQTHTDPRCLDINGVPLEGPDSIFIKSLEKAGFQHVISEEDEPDAYYFHGDYYGINSQLVINVDEESKLLTSALVTAGPYRTFKLFDHNWRYFLLKLQREFGNFTAKGDGSLHLMTDIGYIKISNTLHDDKSRTIKVFYLNTAPYYKDAINLGLHGKVQEVITENPVMESEMMHFSQQGRNTTPEFIDRQYSPTGYLISAAMIEPTGKKSLLTYKYDHHNRLVKRTLTNTAEGIHSINEYQWSDDDELKSQSQKVFDKSNTCVLSINMKNNYTAHDEEGNWTRNEAKLLYWEEGSKAQTIEVTQNRTISYWEE
ncbi:MAG: hypothetical protein K5764_00100 [Prevotella sp.]|nr:hypothetical protein [Prevotella sp.]